MYVVLQFKEEFMKKIALLFVLLVCALMCSCVRQIPDIGGSEEIELYPKSVGLEFTSNKDGTCSVTGRGRCTDARIVIPAVSPDGKTVTTIGEEAFCADKTLVSVTLPETLLKVESNAFRYCQRLFEVINLSKLEIDDNLLGYSGYYGGIGEYAKEIHNGPGKMERINGLIFYKMDGENYVVAYDGSDSDIVFPANWHGESYFLLDDLLGFDEKNPNRRITSVTFPDNALVKNIGNSAFKNCRALTTVSFGKNCNIDSIGLAAFDGCSKLSAVNFETGNTLKSIGTEAFSRCSNLYKFDFSLLENLETIERSAFSGCDSLTSVNLRASVREIGEAAFASCFDLAIFTFEEGSSITSIPRSMLSCSSLTEIRIPEGVTEIGGSAFSSSAIKTVYLPKSLKTVWYHPFLGSNLETVYYYGTPEEYQEIEFYSPLSPSPTIVYNYDPKK